MQLAEVRQSPHDSISPERPAEVGPRENASRARIRSLLAPFLCQDGCVVEQLDDRPAPGRSRLAAFVTDLIVTPFASDELPRGSYLTRRT